MSVPAAVPTVAGAGAVAVQGRAFLRTLDDIEARGAVVDDDADAFRLRPIPFPLPSFSRGAFSSAPSTPSAGNAVGAAPGKPTGGSLDVRGSGPASLCILDDDASAGDGGSASSSTTAEGPGGSASSSSSPAAAAPLYSGLWNTTHHQQWAHVSTNGHPKTVCSPT